MDGQPTDPGADPGAGSVKEGLRRRLARLAGNRDLVLTATDQILSSTSNFVLGVLIGRLAGPGPFGAYILAFTVWLVVVGVHRALVTEPIVISRALDGDRQSVLRRGFEADLLLAGGLGVAVALAGVVVALTGSGDIGVSLIVLAVVLPALVAQDYWRAMAFALHRPGVALANDAIFVGGAGRGAGDGPAPRGPDGAVVPPGVGRGGRSPAPWRGSCSSACTRSARARDHSSPTTGRSRGG